jgi:HEAT repeat protein
MSARKNFELQVAAIEQLRRQPASEATAEALEKALGHRNNYIAGKAAQIACELGLRALAPAMLAAIDRFFFNPVKSDPQCWAKNALVRALSELGHDDSEVYVRSLRHVQEEPVWGGQQDTAAPLRAVAALALVRCRDLSDITILTHLVEPLTDRDKGVRVEAARAIGRIGRREGALLLRLRALMNDDEPEVLGACFSAVLSIEEADGVSFVGRFLDAGDDRAGEAALSLGETRTGEAFQVLHERWKSGVRDPEFAAVLMTAMALTRQREAVDLLIALVEEDSSGAADAIKALASAPLPEASRSRLNAAVAGRRHERLRAVFEKHFGQAGPAR